MFSELFENLKSTLGVELITKYGIPEEKLEDVLKYAKWTMKSVFNKELKASGMAPFLKMFAMGEKVKETVFYKNGVAILSSKLTEAGLHEEKSMGAARLIVGEALLEIQEKGRELKVRDKEELKELLDSQHEGFLDRLEDFIGDTLGNVSSRLGGVGKKLGNLFEEEEGES